MKAKKSAISPNDVEWIIDEKTGWSACSEDCAGGKGNLWWPAMRTYVRTNSIQ